ncbi:unannotated protein [freshwater metagenome]|uniref:Unannotated protein n=1 Tax=freshwater metagenome TaxID=449393 RepID=A0A6J7G7X0_9ZZZZ
MEGLAGPQPRQLVVPRGGQHDQGGLGAVPDGGRPRTPGHLRRSGAESVQIGPPDGRQLGVLGERRRTEERDVGHAGDAGPEAGAVGVAQAEQVHQRGDPAVGRPGDEVHDGEQVGVGRVGAPAGAGGPAGGRQGDPRGEQGGTHALHQRAAGRVERGELPSPVGPDVDAAWPVDRVQLEGPRPAGVQRRCQDGPVDGVGQCLRGVAAGGRGRAGVRGLGHRCSWRGEPPASAGSGRRDRVGGPGAAAEGPSRGTFDPRSGVRRPRPAAAPRHEDAGTGRPGRDPTEEHPWPQHPDTGTPTRPPTW